MLGIEPRALRNAGLELGFGLGLEFGFGFG